MFFCHLSLFQIRILPESERIEIAGLGGAVLDLVGAASDTLEAVGTDGLERRLDVLFDDVCHDIHSS